MRGRDYYLVLFPYTHVLPHLLDAPSIMGTLLEIYPTDIMHIYPFFKPNYSFESLDLFITLQKQKLFFVASLVTYGDVQIDYSSSVQEVGVYDAGGNLSLTPYPLPFKSLSDRENIARRYLYHFGVSEKESGTIPVHKLLLIYGDTEIKTQNSDFGGYCVDDFQVMIPSDRISDYFSGISK